MPAWRSGNVHSMTPRLARAGSMPCAASGNAGQRSAGASQEVEVGARLMAAIH
jgi:hypothetical protein